ncbi:Lin0512 family protein [Rhodobacteraceae bacterium N5(2021)]|uniref:Lin0512 family protein n=1 Tax=Gymnodinialimonas phycosphaerae TaxID=2841589 RepID=A0A975TT65_9RHOB|nr:Lin0512 family protein [Gymnodinialimonas phycosphaerae]MBY4894031.1 Lin0512 family protein [Gymnodinialimonas phycosphaerae]
MAVKRLLTEFGMGSSLRRQDYTEAATRAVKDALWHNSINLAELFGKDKAEMQITVEVGVQNPDALDVAKIAAIFPYGQVKVAPRKGGLDVPRNDGGNPTVIANVAISVALDLEAPLPSATELENNQ